MNYQDYLKSPDWTAKRNNKKRKINRCGICGETKSLDVHHLNYKNLYDVDGTDLRVLCHRCHFVAHRLFKEGKIVFRNNDHNSRFAIIKNEVKKELGLHMKNLFSPEII